MTPLPKRRISTRRKGKRRATIKLHLPTLVCCPSCGSLKKPHHVCQKCGFYSKKAKTPTVRSEMK